jgi:hypothetical protein
VDPSQASLLGPATLDSGVGSTQHTHLLFSSVVTHSPVTNHHEPGAASGALPFSPGAFRHSFIKAHQVEGTFWVFLPPHPSNPSCSCACTSGFSTASLRVTIRGTSSACFWRGDQCSFGLGQPARNCELCASTHDQLKNCPLATVSMYTCSALPGDGETTNG